MLTYKPEPGISIEAAAAQAISAARLQGGNVSFAFNGITIDVNRDSFSSEVAMRYERLSDERRQSYLASPEGIAAAEKRRVDVSQRQARIEARIEELKTMAKKSSLYAILAWMITYSLDADDVGVDAHNQAVIEALEGAGHTRSQDVGKIEDGDYERSARWIVGQVIDMAYRGLPPHHMLSEFAKTALIAAKKAGAF